MMRSRSAFAVSRSLASLRRLRALSEQPTPLAEGRVFIDRLAEPIGVR